MLVRYYAPAHREAGSEWALLLSVRPFQSVLSVRPSVRPSRTYRITRRPSVPKFGRKVPHLWCDSQTSFRVKRSRIKVTKPVNADTHRAPYLPNGNWPTNFKLVEGWRTTIRISHIRHNRQGQRSRSQGHVISLSRLGLMLYLCD